MNKETIINSLCQDNSKRNDLEVFGTYPEDMEDRSWPFIQQDQLNESKPYKI